jgi:tRNA/tmRNA/rRNA uracil-C5-methylase (TrmA/RlmC/RlmD family)
MSRQPGCEAACPGCAHRDFSCSESIAQKTRWLNHVLSPWQAAISPIRTLDEAFRYGYRDRATLSTQWCDGSWMIGMRRGDDVISIPDCPVHTPRVRKIVARVQQLTPGSDQVPLLYLLIAGAQVTLVVKSKELPERDWEVQLWGALQAVGVEGLWLHTNPCVGRRRVTGKQRWRLIGGSPRSRDTFGLQYGPQAFQQLTPSLYAEAITRAMCFLCGKRTTALVDLYCGTGYTSRVAMQYGANAIGIELGAEAVQCAANNNPEMQVLRGTCENRLPQITEWLMAQRHGKEVVIFVNPPRTGLEPAIVSWIADKSGCQRMAYLSCSAGTLARDLHEFTQEYNFHVDEIAVYDFFPNTLHVETLALLSRY